MGKSFLDRLDDTFGSDTLSDVIPHTVTKSSLPKKKPNPPKRVAKRKKKFLENIDDGLPVKSTASKKSGKKSFLDTIEEALEDHAFDDLFPTKKDAAKRRASQINKSRFNILLTTEVLSRARQIARQKSIQVDDVINIALKRYVEKEAE